MKANTYLIINRYQKSRISDRRRYVTLAYEHGGAVRNNTKSIVDDEEEEVPIKRQGPYGTKNNWQLFVHNGRHNHKIVVYNYSHAQAARLMEEYHVRHRNILRFFREQNVGCAIRKYTMLLRRLRRTGCKDETR
ncbi:hypothetical protein M9H77_09119 [Catharanthus roseus]|uniref:Uncharacterized protein n=1 Tax=Catharanthus roseus TaxID=4058 RepID=A0ACC0BZN6_CATRO|nr:hypothetical protein M9H77_09119 [Catharanthus roseus]